MKHTGYIHICTLVCVFQKHVYETERAKREHGTEIIAKKSRRKTRKFFANSRFKIAILEPFFRQLFEQPSMGDSALARIARFILKIVKKIMKRAPSRARANARNARARSA